MNRPTDRHKQEAAGQKMKSLRCVAWNVRGWRGTQSGGRKISRIKGEIEDYDLFILTETHLSEEPETIEKFEKNMTEFHLFHAHVVGD